MSEAGSTSASGPAEGGLLPDLQRFRATIDGLWPRLASLDEGGPGTRILCLASQHGDGTTTIASCAAMGLAENLRADVLLLEANFRTPSMAARFGFTGPPGLGEVLLGASTWRQAVRKTYVPTLAVLPAGSDDRAARALAGDALARILEEARNAYRYVVVDAPPLGLYPDSRILMRHVEALLPVVCAGRTRKEAARSMLRELDDSSVPSVCTVLNRFAGKRVEFLEFSAD